MIRKPSRQIIVLPVVTIYRLLPPLLFHVIVIDLN
jgi:hypothetical protein